MTYQGAQPRISINDLIGSLSRAGYSDQAIAYFLTQPSMGALPDADRVFEMTGQCGDTMRVYFKLDHDRIQDIKFEVRGCAGTITAAMAAADLVRGKTLKEAALISDRDVFKALKSIPESKTHCIHLAVKTLHQAVEDAMVAGREA